ncbi:hypothetical protein LEP1GSC173_2811 [Leptospira interrogans str. HAI1594]|nr:hypothetical protein LEP1GSC173_2811 [Leptospira interrogans str. HAI1594]
MIHFSEKKLGSKFYRLISQVWELPQITILRISSQVVETHTFRKFFLIFLHKTHVNDCNFDFVLKL